MKLRPLAAALLLAAPLAAPVLAQGYDMTLRQVESRYPRMKEVHIMKCDHDGNGTFNRTEMLCVSSIYNSMYRNN